LDKLHVEINVNSESKEEVYFDGDLLPATEGTHFLNKYKSELSFLSDD